MSMRRSHCLDASQSCCRSAVADQTLAPTELRHTDAQTRVAPRCVVRATHIASSIVWAGMLVLTLVWHIAQRYPRRARMSRNPSERRFWPTRPNSTNNRKSNHSLCRGRVTGKG
jgi:hypothetical protein